MDFKKGSLAVYVGKNFTTLSTGCIVKILVAIQDETGYSYCAFQYPFRQGIIIHENKLSPLLITSEAELQLLTMLYPDYTKELEEHYEKNTQG